MMLASHSEEYEDEDDAIIPEEEDNAMPVLKGRKKNQVMTPAIHVPDNYQPPIYGKDETTQAWIRGCLATNKIFKGLLPSDHQMLCDAFKACSFAPGETIIRQGDAGENFYLVESGECDISVMGQGSVMKATTGLAFGELALLQNAPRAATVTAETAVCAWSLDMLSFRAILVSKSRDDASKFMSILDGIALLAPLSAAEKSTLCGSMREVEYLAGEDIIREGEEGNAFYVIREGEVKCTKAASGEAEVSRRLVAGDFFGELALISSEPRAATVTCVAKSTVLAIDRATFERVLGSLDELKTAAAVQGRS